MLTNPILYRVLTDPFLYQWLFAIVFPFLLWAVLVKLARNHPGILPHVLPWLKTLTWRLWLSLIPWSLYCLFARPGAGIFMKVQTLIVTVYSGTHLMYHWVRRRVDPDAYIQRDYGWWPAPKTHK